MKPHPSDVVVKPRDVMPAGAPTLPAAYYTSAQYFEREMDLLFRRMWICAGREEQIEAVGRYFLRELHGDSIIVTRGPSGRARAFHNVCRHRGTRLCTDPQGAIAGTIDSPYHA